MAISGIGEMFVREGRTNLATYTDTLSTVLIPDVNKLLLKTWLFSRILLNEILQQLLKSKRFLFTH